MPRSRYFWINLAPALHLILCALVGLTRSELLWKIVMIADIPMSFIAGALFWYFDHLLLWVTVLGTLWWYLISGAIEMVIRRVSRRRSDRVAQTNG